jgi:hypothetical protein
MWPIIVPQTDTPIEDERPRPAPAPPVPLTADQKAYQTGYDAGYDECAFVKDQEIARLKAELVIVKRRLTDAGR